MKKRWTLLVVALAAPLVRCVLVVPDETRGTACRFSGDQTTACGECIAAHCQAEVNACCADPSCASHLDTLDECAGGSSCSGLAIAPVIAKCVSTSCLGCGIPDGGFPDAPAGGVFQSSCMADGDGCTCSGTGTPNATRCDTTTVTAAVCCADVNYPAKNNYCSCEVFVCDPASYGAFCSAGSYDKGTHSWSGGQCCASDTYCTCDTNASSCAGSGEKAVSTCSASAIGCRADQRRVESCSF